MVRESQSGWVDTGGFSPEDQLLLAFAEQLRTEDDLLIGMVEGDLDVLITVATSCGVVGVNEGNVLEVCQEAWNLYITVGIE